VLFLWNVLSAFGPRLLGLALGALPGLALAVFGALGFARGLLSGVQLSVLAVVLAFAAAVLAFVAGRAPRGRAARTGARRRSSNR
jgi:hypothetical protein